MKRFLGLHFGSTRMEVETIRVALDQWRTAQGLGKKPRTQKFHAEIAEIILRHWPQGQAVRPCPDSVLMDFAKNVAHYCPSRWNCIVSAIRFMTQNPKALRYRKLRFKDFKPPTQEQFAALLAECDKAPKSLCGLIVRFLSLTGLRINEARQLRWENVLESCIEVPSTISKNGLARSVPLLPGAREVLTRLREHATTGLVLTIPSMRTALRKACARAGVPQMSNHSFRHIFATKSVEAGVDLATVSKWLGHQDGGALLGRQYFHLLSDHSRQMAAKVRICV